MPVSSNQYASKVFSEHPLVCWPLDDDVSYISMITDVKRDLSNQVYWTRQKCTVSEIQNPPSPSPFYNSNYYLISGTLSEIINPNTEFSIQLDDALSSTIFTNRISTFSINFFIYSYSTFVKYIQIGFKYWDDNTSSEVENLVNFNITNNSWNRIDQTFDIPNTINPIDIFIRIIADPGGVSGDYDLIINGLSVGQGSKKTSSSSLGVTPIAVPDTTGLENIDVVPADQYGPLSEKSYYIVENNFLLSKNIGVPLVFGSENSTRILSSENNNPSFIFPGKETFSDYTKESSSTIEFWLRIKPNTKTPTKIFGPIGSDYGLYVSEGFITLRMGSKISGYSVGSWYRPMLVHFTLTPEKCYLLINGENVIELNLQDEVLENSINDWVGFFNQGEIDFFEIDCISIYPYEVPINVAKRRLVWGQGTIDQNIIDPISNEVPTSIDISTSNLSCTIIYPDKERWDASYYDNLICDTQNMTVPNYKLPEIFLNGRNELLWLKSNKQLSEIEIEDRTFFTFRPGISDGAWQVNNPSWNEKSYLKFDSSHLSYMPISSFYSIFKAGQNSEEIRPLIHIENSLLNKRFEINIQGTTVSYSYDGNQLFEETVNLNEYIYAGINFEKMIQTYGYSLASFFASTQNLYFYIGGAPDNLNSYSTFEGKIFKVCFLNSFNSESVKDQFNSQGFSTQQSLNLLQHNSTYCLEAYKEYNTFFIDISVSSYWEEYFPLQYFGKYIYDRYNNDYYGFDFLQFNIEYPSISKNVIIEKDFPDWDNYLSFYNEYNYPTISQYQSLDNDYETYSDLNQKIKIIPIRDNSDSSVRMYATFQLLAEGCNQPLNSFPYSTNIPENFVIDASNEAITSDPYRAYKTKFELMNNCIIYPPKNISIENVAIVLHMVINQSKILTNKFNIPRMSLFSRSLNFSQPNAIGTKYGKNIYPVTKNGIYYNYKTKNPFLISTEYYKYLYLTESSGIEVLNQSIESTQYMIDIPLNQNEKENFYISSIQFFVKKNNLENDSFNTLLELDSLTKQLKFILTKNSDNEYVLSCIDKANNAQYNNLTYYQNAIQVTNPVLEINEWNLISIFFDPEMNMSSYSGSINIFSGAKFDNISIYSPDQLGKSSTTVIRKWTEIYENEQNELLDWQYWYNQDGLSQERSWRQAYLYDGTKIYFISPKDIAQKYFGTNIKIIDDDSGFIINNTSPSFSVYSDRTWSTFTVKPA